jgi:hypothetical protein
LEIGRLSTIVCAAPRKKKEKKMVDKSFLCSTTMSMDASKRSLAKATANELEEYKKWLSKQYF